jgi:hypothetical protein
MKAFWKLAVALLIVNAVVAVDFDDDDDDNDNDDRSEILRFQYRMPQKWALLLSTSMITDTK